MTEITAKTNEQAREPYLGFGFWFPLLFVISSSILRSYLPFFAASILAGVVTACIGYFTLSKPRVGFVRFFVYAQVCVAVVLTVIWLAPQWLEAAMPKFWAHALPALLLSNAAYFLPPLDRSKGVKRGALWKWILGSFLFAGFYGWIMSFEP